MWWDIMDNVDIDRFRPSGEERKLTLYCLRKFSITCGLMAGINHYEIAKTAGTLVSQIEKHYEHLDMKKLMVNLSNGFKIDDESNVVRYVRKG